MPLHRMPKIGEKIKYDNSGEVHTVAAIENGIIYSDKEKKNPICIAEFKRFDVELNKDIHESFNKLHSIIED